MSRCVARSLLTVGIVAALALAGASTAAAAPVPSFTVSPSPSAGHAVTFTSTSTADPGLSIAGAAWDFDGDGVTDATGRVARHVFAQPGSYGVGLTVTDTAGIAASVTQPVTVAPNAPPVAAFIRATAVPIVGAPVTFISRSRDPDGTIAAQQWDLDGDGLFDDASGPVARFTYPTPGAHTVRLLVTDDSGAQTTATSTFDVDQPPVAAFAIAPQVIVTGNVATFTSTSSDPDGRIVRTAWDLDGDGRFDDATTATAARRYTAPAVVVVGLQVTDDAGAQATATGLLTILGPGPLASFSFAPTAPVAGEPVVFTSHATDLTGTITALSWDLDGDGRFNDAAGATAVRAYPAAGSVVVALRATDSGGASSVAFQTVTVGAAPAAPGAAAPPAPPSSRRALLMSPFPIVRIRGSIVGSVVRVDLLSVRAGRGASVRVRCRGPSCPRRQFVARSSSVNRPVRMRALERRYRAGAVLEVFVTKRGRIGKYVRFAIRRNAAPARRDLCIAPGARRPSRCPAE